MKKRDSVWLICLCGLLTIVGCASTPEIKSTGNTEVDMILHQASDLLGTKYCYAGNTPDCFDCSGFVSYCFSSLGYVLPRRTTDLFISGRSISSDELFPGDLVFFNTNGRNVSHVGIYIGEERFIHSSTSNGVMISQLKDVYWGPRYLGARRVVSN